MHGVPNKTACQVRHAACDLEFGVASPSPECPLLDGFARRPWPAQPVNHSSQATQSSECKIDHRGTALRNCLALPASVVSEPIAVALLTSVVVAVARVPPVRLTERVAAGAECEGQETRRPIA